MTLRIGPALAAGLVIAVFCSAGGDKPVEFKLPWLAEWAYSVLWDFHPVDATCQGNHERDSLLGNYSAESVADAVKKLRMIMSVADRMDVKKLTVDEQIDRELLLANVRMELFRLERLRVWQTNPRYYTDECISGVYYLLLRDFAPLNARAKSVAARMADVPRLLAQARANVKNPPRIYAGAAIRQLSDGERLFEQTAASLAEQVPELEGELTAAGAAAVKAMQAYRAELEKQLPKLKDSFAMGRENFDYILKTEHRFTFGADSLLRMGENLLRETDATLKARRAQQAEYHKTHPRPEEPAQVAPADYSKQDALAAAQAEVESMRVWTGAQFVTVPEYVGRLQITETPEFMRSYIPGLAMEPPAPLDSVQTSYYYMPPIPDPLDSAARAEYYHRARRRGWRGGIVHEGFPGHHLQLSIANHHPSLIRKLQGHTPLIEGWALYCEQMVVEQGLYGKDDFPDLRWLGGVKFRAARIVVDVKLHTGQMSFDDAVQFMVRELGDDTAFFRGEVSRYCLSPTQPMSYLTGKMQILALREEFRKKQGTQYSLRNFHDRLLAEGSIPLSLSRRKLLGE